MIDTCFEKWRGAPEENFIENQMVWCSDQKSLSITRKLEHPGNSNTLENYFVNPGNSNVRVSRGKTVNSQKATKIDVLGRKTNKFLFEI